MRLGDPEGYVDALRQSREEGHDFLTEVFERWRAESWSFEDYFHAESRRWAVSMLAVYKDHIERLVRHSQGEAPFTLDLAFPASAVDHVRVIKHALEQAGVSQDDLWPRLLEYVGSGIVEWLPFNRIAAALWATLATQAKTRSKVPGRGMVTDVQMISTLLPYCDAMLVDRECHGLLKNIPAGYRPDYPCRVFSASTREEFLAYLRDIERSVPEEHMTKVREVYGDRIDRTASLIPKME
jgi:hypothetical protein